MKRIFKKLMALTLALSMVGSTIALAAELDPQTGDVGGSGEMEGYVAAAADVYSVELPTSGFNFTLDPQGLIVGSNAEAYEGFTKDNFTGDKGLYFPNYTNDVLTGYSQYSEILAIINRGTVDVTVELTALITGTSNAEVATSETFDTDPAIYMAVEKAAVNEETGEYDFETATTTVVTAEDAATVYEATTVVKALKHKEEAVYRWNSETQEYYEEYPEGDVVTYYGLYFRVTGAINTQADWGALYDDEEFVPELTLAWTIDTEAEVEEYTEYLKPYTVTFDMNGHGENFTQTVLDGKYAEVPASPEVKGYDFVGWFTDAECTEAFAFETTAIEKNTTIYSKWDMILPTVASELTITAEQIAANSYTFDISMGAASEIKAFTFVAAGSTMSSSVSGTKRVINVDEAGEGTVTVTYTDLFSKFSKADSITCELTFLAADGKTVLTDAEGNTVVVKFTITKAAG